jgi:hypothetical protein
VGLAQRNTTFYYHPVSKRGRPTLEPKGRLTAVEHQRRHRAKRRLKSIDITQETQGLLARARELVGGTTDQIVRRALMLLLEQTRSPGTMTRIAREDEITATNAGHPLTRRGMPPNEPPDPVFVLPRGSRTSETVQPIRKANSASDQARLFAEEELPPRKRKRVRLRPSTPDLTVDGPPSSNLKDSKAPSKK